jgi:hypothetical protein
MRPRVLALLGALAGLIAPAAEAQTISWLYDVYSDSALVIPVGQTRTILLYASLTGGVSSYTVRVFLDDARVRIVDADSFPGYGLPSPTITTGTNEVTLSATGTGYGFGTYLARLFVEMDPGAAEGSLLSIKVDQLLNQAGASFNLPDVATDILNVCQSRALWGDPDSSLAVTGRDALIALTYAVQLPVTGFGVALADVDEDTQVTSRDALIILSAAVGADTYSYYRTGVAIPNRCAPLAGVPTEMAFLRGTAAGNLFRVPAGDTVAVPVGSATAFYSGHYVRWSPDGTRILGTAYTSPYYYDPIAVTLATLAEDTLARVGNYDGGGTYAPDGARIAFLTDRTPYLWVMDANGSNQFGAQDSVTTGVPYSSTNPAWSPNGERVAFTGYYPLTTTNALWSVGVRGADSGNVRLEFPVSASYSPIHPAWSPPGDSLLFQASNRLYVTASPEATATPQRVAALSVGSQDWPSWISAGIVFRWVRGATYDYYLRQPNGRILRIFRAAGGADYGGSFR